MDHVRQELGVSERRACRTLGQHRSMQRKVPQGRADEQRLSDDIIDLADQYGRYGYRMVAGLANNTGWHVNHKRVERIWRREGLKVPQKQNKKGRLWLNDGSCVRLRPERPNHVYSYDFVQDLPKRNEMEKPGHAEVFFLRRKTPVIPPKFRGVRK